ncbi:MAG TPA: DUF362 domain-containing protein [Chitinivibrionales bacterium]|nr:DUF362 domain-containing protein [Chitinivibrionales bacterium]
MAKHAVAVISGLTYNDPLADVLYSAVETMELTKKLALTNKSVALKPNLFLPCPPEQAATTHPAVIESAIVLAKKMGGRPVIIESPGGSRINPSIKRAVFSVTGAETAARTHSCEIKYNDDAVEKHLPNGTLIKTCLFLKDIFSVDAIINVPKLKTHCYGHITGACKNMFGIVPGVHKANFHLRMPDPAHFFNAILDIIDFVPPALSIVDAIVAMEGDGPNSGSPLSCGIILVGEHPVAVDRVACTCMGIDDNDVPVLACAKKRGFGPASLADIEILTIGAFSPFRFRKPARSENPNSFTNPVLKRLMKNSLVLFPEVIPKKCTGCGTCVNSCPVRVIGFTKKKKATMLDRDACIRCYCCHELCPSRAIVLRKSVLFRVAKVLLAVAKPFHSKQKGVYD